MPTYDWGENAVRWPFTCLLATGRRNARNVVLARNIKLSLVILITYREIRRLLFQFHAENIIDDEELLLLLDVNKSYWSYKQFDLEDMTDYECNTEFRFLKNDIYKLAEVLRIPQEIICPNRIKINGMEDLCVYLEHFAYPCRWRVQRLNSTVCSRRSSDMFHIQYGDGSYIQ